jgi:hypothetical protein
MIAGKETLCIIKISRVPVPRRVLLVRAPLIRLGAHSSDKRKVAAVSKNQRPAHPFRLKGQGEKRRLIVQEESLPVYAARS